MIPHRRPPLTPSPLPSTGSRAWSIRNTCSHVMCRYAVCVVWSACRVLVVSVNWWSGGGSRHPHPLQTKILSKGVFPRKFSKNIRMALSAIKILVPPLMWCVRSDRCDVYCARNLRGGSRILLFKPPTLFIGLNFRKTPRNQKKKKKQLWLGKSWIWAESG